MAKETLTFLSTFRRQQQLLLLQHPRRRRLSHPRGTTTQPTWREDLVFLNSRSHARSKEIENTLVVLTAATSYCKTAFCLSFTSLTCHCVPPSLDPAARGTVCAAFDIHERVEQLCCRAGQQLAVDVDVCCCERR